MLIVWKIVVRILALLSEKKKRTRINPLFLTTLFLLFCFHSYSQNKTDNISILFYNVENLFDIEHDSLINDNDFTPEGNLHWTSNRLYRKVANISKVILNAGGWTPPEIIALAEIENRKVLNLLLSKTALKSYGYQIVHKESPDHRGIDVALFYNPHYFYPLYYKYLPLVTEKGELLKTREILYVEGIINGNDTLHLLVNHWPSRYSGLLESEKDRFLAAELLRLKSDTINKMYKNPKIIIMGDFNDEPQNKSVSAVLKARPVTNTIEPNKLYNFSYEWKKSGLGTLKYQSQWNVFDQFIVSGALITSNGMYCTPEMATIVNLSFLFEPDEKYNGLKPRRTYVGYKYNGGFSDHLPILLHLKNN